MTENREPEFKMIASRAAQVAILAAVGLCFLFAMVSFFFGAPLMAGWSFIIFGIILSGFAAWNWSVIKMCETPSENKRG